MEKNKKKVEQLPSYLSQWIAIAFHSGIGCGLTKAYFERQI
jgi:hypothetical protein